MLADPAYYAVIALGTRTGEWLPLVLAVAMWFLVSQLPLFVLVASSLLGLHEKVTAWLQTLWVRSKPHISWIVTAAILLVTAVLVADTLHFLIRGQFLIG